MAVPGKRLLWIAIIIVEMVLVYVLWRPVRDRFNRHRRAAVNTPALRSSENHSFETHLPDKRQPEAKQPQAKQAEAKQPAKRLPGAHHEVQSAQVQSPQIAIPSRKPSGAIRHSATALRKQSVVVNAGLKTPEPVTARPVPASPTPIPPPPASIADSFWCNISHAEAPTCDCREKTANKPPTLRRTERLRPRLD
jgi:hypothetical protein